MEKYKDAFGKEIYDYHQGNCGFEIIESDIGCVDIAPGPASYFREYNEWQTFEKRAIRFARGKTVDIGAGAGRVALYLQQKNMDVLATDNSPLAIKVCKLRGVKKAKVVSITQLSRKHGLFDTIIMFGNNFGLFANPKRAKWLLRRFYNMTTDRARIIAQSMDPYDTDNPDHLAYHKHNRSKGKMSGQLRIRVRYKNYKSDFFEYLIVSRNEMQQLLKNTGWQIRKFVDSKGPAYMAIIEKETEK